MKVLVVYARLYAECLTQAINGLKKNAWTLLLPGGLYLAWRESIALLAALFGGSALGLIGGILQTLLMAALFSCYLYFVGEIVSHSRVTLAEMGRSTGAYFWSIVNLSFVLWVAQMLVGMLLRGNPNAGYLMFGLFLIALILLSAAPEAIYQRGTYGGLATIQRSISFLQQHWIEWLVPSAPFLLALWWIPDLSYVGLPGLIATAVLQGAVFHLGMVFRGFLFAALDGSTHRQRMFKYRGSWPVGG
ncbi:MAG TPA: hypothetical protein VKB87_05450 [Myxococcaceae bacterium]|nr:hypothetical protein [Myxococcaceae bacterium]